MWSAFVISIPIYLVIARNVLGNPDDRRLNRASGRDGQSRALAAHRRRSSATTPTGATRNLSSEAILRAARADQALLRALEEFKGGVEERAAYVVILPTSPAKL